eukprot:TRINITY_DN4750_c0_g2_i1.p1 TRINITY_DN4750_c0_g2~~TRINITY_DN4750_c0_g2_i1.p1  ORF type:complete len:363 (-),score=57.39 TRINITY_DN4750_c0_g2_i1:265-1353(-)
MMRRHTSLAALVAIVVLLAVLVVSTKAASWEVKATRLSSQPIITSQKKDSAFTFNYNCAYLNVSSGGHWVDALLIRCQNATSLKPLKIGPSRLALTYATVATDLDFRYVSNASVVFESEGPLEDYGTEDPRVVYWDETKTYYMMYSAVQRLPNSPDLMSRLSLATSTNPADPKSWKRHGPVFPDHNGRPTWSKSGAVLVREGTKYLIFGDSTDMPGIQIASTENLLNYTLIDGIFIHTRDDHFDSALVESGPPPLQLSDGNYLFLYNSARKYPSSPNGLEYNIGWAILDGKDPRKVLARSSEPILSPELPWEVGTPPYLGLTPHVVFVEGMKADAKPNTFTFYYGAADSVVGIASVRVTIKN